MQEMTTEEIRDLLDRSLIGRVAFAREGEPYCIPMPFLYHAGAIYMRLPEEGRKGEMMRANPRVCFEVDEYAPDLSTYASVIAEGDLLEVTDLAEKAAVREATAEKYVRLRGSRPGHGRAPQPLEQMPLRKILLRTLAGRKKG